MMIRLFAWALLVAGLSQAAFAQTSTSPQQSQPSTSAEDTQASQNLPQSLRQRLTSAGFTDVNIVPSSLVITARDRGGRPVLMRITPNSMFFLTEMAAVSSPTTGTGRAESNNSMQQNQSSTAAGAARAESNDSASVQQQNQPSSTVGAARAGSNGGAQPSISAESDQAAQSVPPSLRQRLTSAGFSDIRIVPSSMIITARDESGRPLMMRVTPRSLFLVTEIPAVSASATGAGGGDSNGLGQNR